MAKSEPVAFAPVVVGSAGNAKRREMAMSVSPAPDAAMIEIVLGPAVVRVRNGADARTVSAVIEAIKRLAG